MLPTTSSIERMEGGDEMSTAIAERDLLASMTSCCGRNAATTWRPIRPLAPTTRIFMIQSPADCCVESRPHRPLNVPRDVRRDEPRPRRRETAHSGAYRSRENYLASER